MNTREMPQKRNCRKRLQDVQTLQLIKKLKVSLRRSLIRQWKAEISGKTLVISETLLETMYRGNTPYRIGRVKKSVRTYKDKSRVRIILQTLAKQKAKEGYRSKHTKSQPTA